MKKQKFKCEHCNTEYARQQTVLTHKCVKRDRWNDRESRQFREAFRIFLLFNEKNFIKTKRGITPIQSFIGSPFFNDFYKFSEYILECEIINKDNFIEMLVCSKIPIGSWNSHSVYQDWVIKSIREENVRDAIERTIESLAEWSILSGHEWYTFFENVSTERAKYWFETGKISPWIIYVCEPSRGNLLLSRFENSDLEYLVKFLDPTYFAILSQRNNKEVLELRELLKQYNL